MCNVKSFQFNIIFNMIDDRDMRSYAELHQKHKNPEMPVKSA